MPGTVFRRMFIAAALIAGGGLAIAAVRSPAAGAAQHSLLQVKPGLWEFSDTAKVSGDTVFPDEMLSNVPASQRSQHLAELRRMMSQPGRERECMTQANFEHRLFLVGPGCTQKILSNTPAKLELLTECRANRGSFTQSSKRKVAASSASAATSLEAVSNEGGRTMRVESVENGHWVSANCGNVHGIQQLR